MSDTRENEEGAKIVTEEPDTYEIKVERTIEMDIGAVKAETLRERYQADTVEAALAHSVAEVEAAQVEPTEKLLNLDVEVDVPSDD